MPEVAFAQIQALLDEGLSQKQAAQRLGISESRVSRILTRERSVAAGNGAALRAVDRIAESLGDMTADQQARVEAARALARKIDWSAAANTGAAAMAAASLVRELRSLLDELRAASSFDELRQALLADHDG